ncbi:Biotin carboxylase C-terminal domain family protein [Saccharomyces cerevisiae]|nr:Biotin carboxylase C-terminal domain family protein [Saccharomyces cerevisiae]
MVTGLDLVEWMIRIAANDAPDFDSTKVEVNGVSMEARLYAENPLKNFRPSPGLLVDVKFPDWARVDTWVKKGTNISPEYDPTLAKIIVHGKDRDDAISKLNQALEETKVYGCIITLTTEVYHYQ